MSSSGVIMRRAVRQDVDAIHAMIVAIARTTDDADRVTSSSLDFLRHGFGATRAFEAMVADRDGEPVGVCVYFYTFSTWLGEPGIYVQDLYVADAERGHGLGRRLVAAVARQGRERQASHLRLSVEESNHAARVFYEHIGFEHRDNEHTYHIGGGAFMTLANGQP